jgi:Family of unknown function (DUF6152)
MGSYPRTRASAVASFTIIILLMAFSAPMLAHHGTGTSYDQNITMPVKGKVTEFAWKNPHSALFMDVTDGPFKGRNYAVELNSPGVMIRQGWTKKQFQVGDEVVINVHPSKTGAAVGECLSCTVIVNGKETKPR